MQRLQESPVQIDTSVAVLIAEHVRRLLSGMGFDGARVVCDSSEDSVLRISIRIEDDGSILIGAQGAHLYALQHIIRCILRKSLQTDMYILVDVNGYRARRERGLAGLAEETARKAQRTGQAVVLDPMNAVDRRTIHTALASHKEVQTESLGEGPARRVIVRPVFL
ncbi:MAG TPA: R3H domain-containing nucleic acid-binding protein [Candidatus Andersenbacteria bacterium]|nr:R3H domain-containing nucleic acid-binding protein [Candidatus Andersenbacteria bacterium]